MFFGLWRASFCVFPSFYRIQQKLNFQWLSRCALKLVFVSRDTKFGISFSAWHPWGAFLGSCTKTWGPSGWGECFFLQNRSILGRLTSILVMGVRGCSWPGWMSAALGWIGFGGKSCSFSVWRLSCFGATPYLFRLVFCSVRFCKLYKVCFVCL